MQPAWRRSAHDAALREDAVRRERELAHVDLAEHGDALQGALRARACRCRRRRSRPAGRGPPGRRRCRPRRPGGWPRQGSASGPVMQRTSSMSRRSPGSSHTRLARSGCIGSPDSVSARPGTSVQSVSDTSATVPATFSAPAIRMPSSVNERERDVVDGDVSDQQRSLAVGGDDRDADRRGQPGALDLQPSGRQLVGRAVGDHDAHVGRRQGRPVRQGVGDLTRSSSRCRTARPPAPARRGAPRRSQRRAGMGRRPSGR